MRPSALPIVLTLLSAFALSAQEAQLSLSPALGPSSGRTTVTIKIQGGSFGSWPYGVDFDGVGSTSVTLVDEFTLVAVTPKHAPGITNIRLFQGDVYLSTDLTFEYVGHPDREQFLLPVFIEPVAGAYGSEFRTELHGLNAGRNQLLDVWGLETVCRTTPPICNWLAEPQVSLEPGTFGADLVDYTLYQTGTPGRFIEVPREQKDDLSVSLRVYDTSRAAENFGTEIPVVRTTDFYRTGFALLGVPLDPGFRNTLRLYATGPTTVQLLVGNDIHDIQLRAGAHVFDPAYAQFTAFPAGSGTIRVLVAGEENGPAVWGFISVTNNTTQHITTITPR
jgi:IPT/TIG domain